MNRASLRAELREGYYYERIVRVPLALLVRSLDGSCDDWRWDKDTRCAQWFERIMQNKMLDSQMGYLIDSLLDNGLVTPLNVRYHPDDELFTMGNGHHRLIAALLCGIEWADIHVTQNTDWSLSTISGKRHADDFTEVDDYKDIFEDIFTEVASL